MTTGEAGKGSTYGLQKEPGKAYGLPPCQLLVKEISTNIFKFVGIH